MKELKFLCVQPDDTYYLWQTHLWLESLKDIGKSDKAIVLVFTPLGRKLNVKWIDLQRLYPEAEFAYYSDTHGISKLFGIYIPILRPYTLLKYFKDHPELSEKAILYCDCDIIFTEKFNIDKYVDDDVCYLSDTNSYINASYFDSKIKDVKPDKLEEYKTKDILAETLDIVGITREIAERNNLNSGGAQYLLKNIDAKFWDKVITDCIKIRTYLQNVNRYFFESENKGFQSWCADMWAVLWNLWLRNQETKVIPEMEFAWSTDPINKLDAVGILHNAGATGESMNGAPIFYKSKYHDGKLLPFDDSHCKDVMNNEESKKLCNHLYLSKLLSLKEKYNMEY
jgi:hypothetical protein